MGPKLKLLYTVRGAAKLLGCDERALRRLLQNFSVQLVKVGKYSYVQVADLVVGENKLAMGIRAVLRNRGFDISEAKSSEAEQSDAK